MSQECLVMLQKIKRSSTKGTEQCCFMGSTQTDSVESMIQVTGLVALLQLLVSHQSLSRNFEQKLQETNLQNIKFLASLSSVDFAPKMADSRVVTRPPSYSFRFGQENATEKVLFPATFFFASFFFL